MSVFLPIRSNHAPLPVSMMVAWIAAVLFSVDALSGEVDPYGMEDEAWITIHGTVDNVSADRFDLDYGDDTVLVELDDADADADAYGLITGDEVSVTGRIDRDFFELTKIEAASVHVKNLDTTFFASEVDEEFHDLLNPRAELPLPLNRTVVWGTVSRIHIGGFQLNTGDGIVRVDIEFLPSAQVDGEDLRWLDEGDRVKVIGKISTTLFEGRKLKAYSVVELVDG